MLERNPKAVINVPLSLPAVHYHIFICSSMCAAYVKSEQPKIEFFLQALGLGNKCVFDFTVLSRYGQYAHFDISLLEYMISFP